MVNHTTHPQPQGYRLLQRTDPEPLLRTEIAAKHGAADAADHAIVCAACRHPITSERARICVNRAHLHRCVNPAGYVFEIGCFGSAAGCKTWGAPSPEHTWFPGFAWDYALCGDCRGHLGWRFSGAAGAAFFGLVLNRLVSEEASRR
ncbi:MAG: hypothetical protein HY699_16570 [Deltaproteobacteria bacterium]|nr:hypothetical protein [Deltaproteobacteria bacterium]